MGDINSIKAKLRDKIQELTLKVEGTTLPVQDAWMDGFEIGQLLGYESALAIVMIEGIQVTEEEVQSHYDKINGTGE